MTLEELYGKGNLCKNCGIQPAGTEVDYSRLFVVTYKNPERSIKIILYGQKKTHDTLCHFCRRDKQRDSFQETIPEKRARQYYAMER